MPETIETQRAAWNEWNASTREKELQAISTDQADVIEEWLGSLHRRDLKILEVGCGAGWMAERLSRFGKVTAVDLADEVITRAAKRLPQVSFIAGDFMALDVGGDYDVIVSLEVLSHVVDQPAFVAKIADLLRPGHYLMLATQNRYALEKSHLPRIPGQLRKMDEPSRITRFARAALQCATDVLHHPALQSGLPADSQFGPLAAHRRPRIARPDAARRETHRGEGLARLDHHGAGLPKRRQRDVSIGSRPLPTASGASATAIEASLITRGG
jgi:SAM-dependent methyltransferase